MITYLLVFAGALVLAIAMTPVARWLAPRVGIMDRPEARKIHQTPVPRLGGGQYTWLSLSLHSFWANAIISLSSAAYLSVRLVSLSWG